MPIYGEEAVCLVELMLLFLLIAKLARELGELGVDQRLERARARLPPQLKRAGKRRLDLPAGRAAV